MPAAMPNPWQHPVTKTFYLRVRVPADVRQFDPKEFVKRSLGTKDWKLAKQRFAQEHTALLAERDRLRAANVSPLSKPNLLFCPEIRRIIFTAGWRWRLAWVARLNG